MPLSVAEVRGRYDRAARWWDLVETPADLLLFRPLRRRLAARVRGRVLEVAAGTGRNLPYYPPGVPSVISDLSAGMLARARAKGHGAAVLADLEALPFPDGTFDTVVVTLALCTVPDPTGAVREMDRVCRPGGRLLLLEHVLSRSAPLAWLQRCLTPGQVRRLGCHLDRDAAGAVATAGLSYRVLAERLWGSVVLLEAEATIALGRVSDPPQRSTSPLNVVGKPSITPWAGGRRAAASGPGRR